MTLIASLLLGALAILPASPFQSMIKAIDDSTVLGALNWVIPFAPAVAMLQAWAVCMALYYAYKVLKGSISNIIEKFLS